MKRSVLIFIIIVVIVIGLIAGAWWFFATQNGVAPTTLGNFLPFGGGGAFRDITPPPPTPVIDTNVPEDAGALPALRQLYERPVSGMVAFGSTTTSIRFVERETGHVFEIGTEAITPLRITNTTIPRVQEAVFVDENQVLIRYIAEDGENVQTFLATIEGASAGEGAGKLVGTFLPQNTASLAVSSDKIFYTVAANAQGFVRASDGSTASVLPVAFTEWIAEWISDTELALTTKAAAEALGAYYLFDTQTGVFDRVLGDRIGFTTLTNSDASFVLFSEGGQRSFSLSSLAQSSGQIQSLPLRTLPEKCTWSPVEQEIAYCGVPTQIPAGDYPDHWYQGRIGFADEIWKLNIFTGATELLARPSEVARDDIDVTHPVVTPSGTHLVFINKKDGSLWSLRLPTRILVPEPLFDEE